MRIFFAGPLTNLSDPEKTKTFYEKLAAHVRHHGFDYYWAYQRGTDPELDPDVPASRVYQIDTYELEKSDVMIAYVGEPSVGTGIEVEYARTRKIPVYIMYEKGNKISRMLRGCPSVKGEIVFESEDDAIQQIHKLLNTLVPGQQTSF